MIIKEILEWVLCLVIAYVLYLIINYFGGIKLCKKKPTLILLNQQKLNKTKPLPTSPAVHSYGSEMTNQQ